MEPDPNYSRLAKLNSFQQFMEQFVDMARLAQTEGLVISAEVTADHFTIRVSKPERSVP